MLKKKKKKSFRFFCCFFFFFGWDLLGNIVIYRIIIIRYGCIVFLRLRSSANKLEILKKIACLDGGAGKEVVWSRVKFVKNKLILRKIYSTLFLLVFPQSKRIIS